MTEYKGMYPDAPCAECQRMPVNSRRNTVCKTCGQIVCRRCHLLHFVERHER